MPGLTDAGAIDTAKKALAVAEKAKAGAETQIKALGGATTSLVGLSEPWFPLRNPGLLSIPLAFASFRLAEACWLAPFVLIGAINVTHHKS